MKTFTRSLAALAGSTALLTAMTATAAAPFSPDLTVGGNRWTITFYNDASPNHDQWATQGICFYKTGVVGTQQRYVWLSDTYPDWNGVAEQEGDQVIMHGDFRWPFGQTKDGGHDGMQWEIVTMNKATEGAGHWHEWIENGGFGLNVGFGNTKFVRVGSCPRLTTTTTNGIEITSTAELQDLELKYEQLPQPRDAAGNYLVNPMGVPEKSLGQ